MTRLFLALPLALAACAQPPEPIVAYDVPYVAKWQPSATVRPMPRPVAGQRIYPACIEWPDDCGPVEVWPGLPPLDFTPRDLVPEVMPEPTPEPEAEPEEPAKEWGPA